MSSEQKGADGGFRMCLMFFGNAKDFAPNMHGFERFYDFSRYLNHNGLILGKAGLERVPLGPKWGFEGR